MRVILAFTFLLLNSSVYAQWKKIADFVGPNGYDEYITCIYFLDLPGPPRVGFVGTESRLYKTTDGGETWELSWVNLSGRDYDLYWVTDICFKDSLTGWFSMFGDTDACYRTIDGGKTWKEIYSSPYGAWVYYSQINERLFLALETDSGGLELSEDLGNTWKSAMTDTDIGTPIFLSDSIAIASGSENSPCDTCNFPDTNYGIFRTTDAGTNWKFMHIQEPNQSDGPGQILSIAGIRTCFITSMGEIVVWRSDDYGTNWKKIADFGPFQDSNSIEIAPYGTGYIEGDLHRLTIQTDSGMYISTDSGVTWRNDGGPPCITSVTNDLFYSAKGYTYAAMTYGDGVLYSGGLWEETWPQAGVAEREPAATGRLRVYPSPAAASITVEGSSGPIAIFDPLGRGYSVPTRGATLDVSALPSGVYFISDGVRRTKFIKE